jgi:anhydro-N-acetylmuramic acid kinase
MEKVIVGCMSGTSLDGLDLAVVRFQNTNSFELIDQQSIGYQASEKERLHAAFEATGLELVRTDRWFGEYIGTQVKEFLARHPNIQVDAIASHGHTVFHRPEEGITLQIGNGFSIAKTAKLPVICDFRSRDVSLGGQGAPLVPIADKNLFSGYSAKLNLGGFANVSTHQNGKILAWDLAPCNILLNALCNKIGLDYDDKGELARSGKPIESFIDYWRKMEYWKIPPPKSLGREWVEEAFLPQLKTLEIRNALHSLCLLIAESIDQQIPKENTHILVSGGGAHNDFLMECLNRQRPNAYVKAPEKIIDFKEAIAFAYLGYLFLLNENNVLASVTGAAYDHVGGVMVR